LFNAFSFEAAGAKEKAWRKENAVYSGLRAPNPRELFGKSSTKN